MNILKLIKYTIQNKKMSPIQKLYRVKVLVLILFGELSCYHSQYTLLALIDTDFLNRQSILIRKIERLKKRGHKIRLELWLKRTELFQPDFQKLKALGRLTNLKVQSIKSLKSEEIYNKTHGFCPEQIQFYQNNSAFF